MIKPSGEIDCRPMMLPGRVVILYGKTEQDITAQLRQHGLLPPEGSDR